MSLPSRERGLKFAKGTDDEDTEMSLPSRERGLKFTYILFLLSITLVAPFAGAWIEIVLLGTCRHESNVAPFAGAWIEIPSLRR